MIPIIKAVHPDMRADAPKFSNPFYYPPLGTVEDRDGHGLHGFPFGIGRVTYISHIRNAKFLVLMAGNVLLTPQYGKCKFMRADVIGCYDHADEAAIHVASLTLFWATPDAKRYLVETGEDQHEFVYLARTARDNISTKLEALAEGVRIREQRWREQVSSGIPVPDWPMPNSASVPVKIKRKEQHAKSK